MICKSPGKERVLEFLTLFLKLIYYSLAGNIIDHQGILNTSQIVPQSLANREVDILLSSMH